MPSTAKSVATIGPAAGPVVVKVYDSPNNFGVYTLTLHDATSGAKLDTYAENVNSGASPDHQYPKQQPPPPQRPIAAGQAVVCFVNLVPVGGQGPLQFTLRAYQGDQQIDDGQGQLNIASSTPDSGAIRMVFQ